MEGQRTTVQRKQTLKLRADGAVLLAEEYNHAEGVEVVFDPPLEVLPARVEQGSESTGRGGMTVHPLGDRTRVRAKGAYTSASRVERAARIRTPAGEFIAWKIVSRLDADLGPSRVSNNTESWVVPGVGLVAERQREETKVIGIKVRNNQSEWVAAKVPAAEKR